MSFGGRMPRNFSMEALWELYRIGRTKTIGNLFFVDGIAGLDTNDGLSRSAPFKTIAHALDQCVDDHDDVIIVMDCWQQETFPISVDVSRVHILGVDDWNGMYPRMIPPGDTAVFQIPGTKSFFEIANFGLGAGATHAAIEFVGGVEARGRIHDCWFGWIGAGQDGIRIGNDAPEMLIDHNLFGPGLTRDGIRIDSACTRSIIRDNIFRKVPGIGIHVGITMASFLGGIIDNKFSLPSNTQGKAISFLHAGCSDALVVGNHAMFGVTAMAANPYVDIGSNDWGCNWVQCYGIPDGLYGVCNCKMPVHSL